MEFVRVGRRALALMRHEPVVLPLPRQVSIVATTSRPAPLTNIGSALQRGKFLRQNGARFTYSESVIGLDLAGRCAGVTLAKRWVLGVGNPKPFPPESTAQTRLAEPACSPQSRRFAVWASPRPGSPPRHTLELNDAGRIRHHAAERRRRRDSELASGLWLWTSAQPHQLRSCRWFS